MQDWSENKVFYDESFIIYDLEFTSLATIELPELPIRREGPTAAWNAAALDGYLTFFIFKGNKLLKIHILIRLI